MKQFLLFPLLGLALCLAVSCSDGNTIGPSIQPEKDIVTTDTATFVLQSQTQRVDSILHRTSEAILGEFTDTRFGTTKSGFMTQLYCPPAYHFPDTVVSNRIDSAYLYLFFNNWLGDGTSLFEVTVYQMEKALNLDVPYYTNIRVQDYCSMSKRLGACTYTPKSATNIWTESNQKYCVRIPIDAAFGQQIFDDSRADTTLLDGPRRFAEYLKGLYLTTNYGNGALVYIEMVELELCYKTPYTRKDGTQVDTTSASYFLSTKEVKTVNVFEHPDLDPYLAESFSDSINYLFSPAGLYTRIRVPLDHLTTRLSGKNINFARIKLQATCLDNSDWGLKPPSDLLIMRESDIHSFFGEYRLADNEYSILSSYDESDSCFVFDVSTYVQKSIRYQDGTLDSTSTFVPYADFYVVPVTTHQNSSSVDLYLSEDVSLTGVKIRSAVHPLKPMKLELVYSDRNSQTL